MFPAFLLLSAWGLASVRAAITVYGANGVTTPSAFLPPSTTYTSGIPSFTGLAAYNPVILAPPPLPSPLPPTQFTLAVPNNAQLVQGLSIPQMGTFYGFSIEMSVAIQLIGINSTYLNVPFLNLMSIIAERAGAVHIRVGGNTQETAVMVNSLADGKMIEKDKEDASNPTSTPVLTFTAELIYMLSNVSSLVNTKWYLGIPFNDTTNFRFEIAESAEAILGNNLLGFQVGNEPDLYADHGHRPANYTQFDYFGEFALLTEAVSADAQFPVRNNLIAPSIQGLWSPESVWNTGFLTSYDSFLGALAVEHYPSDNCAIVFPTPNNPPHDPNAMFPTYLTHDSGKSIVAPYLNSTNIAQTVGKPFLMFETNTASCGGFPGISDAFGSALWALDYGLQMAYSNFTGALLHAGGQNVSYNPFTAPPTNQTAFHQWTIGPIFYAAVVVAEALGNTNTSRVMDLNANSANPYTPAYSIYENGNLARMVLINFMTDPSGANTYTATLSAGGSQFGEANAVPAQVKVKYLASPSVSEKNNITWANQTLGGQFQADGRWQGNEMVYTVNCDQMANTCQVEVPAPGAALVFFSDAALQESTPQSTQTFATTAVTKVINTATVDPSVLATSNGENGSMRGTLSGTSQGSSGAQRAAGIAPSLAGLASVLAGLAVLCGAFR